MKENYVSKSNSKPCLNRKKSNFLNTFNMKVSFYPAIHSQGVEGVKPLFYAFYLSEIIKFLRKDEFFIIMSSIFTKFERYKFSLNF